VHYTTRVMFYKLGAASAAALLGLKEFAPGIPVARDTKPLPEVKKPQTWQLAIQRHDADVAGPHLDLRLVDPETGYAHSWALPKAQMPKPGKSVLAVQQPTHTANYALNFGKDRERKIPFGYGKGTVKMETVTDVDVFHAKPEEEGTRLRFNVYKSTGPEEYAIVRTQSGSDLLVNKTLTRERLPHLRIGDRPKLRETSVDKIDTKDTSQVLMPKYDGAHTLLDLQKAGRIPRLYSYRTPKRHHAGVIEHTHKVPELLEMRVPADLKGTVLRAETIAVTPDGKAIPAKDIGGMLNAAVTASRQKQKEMGATLTPIVIDIDRYKGKDVSTLPFNERIDLARAVSERLELTMAEVADTPTAKKQLITKVTQGKHPMTSEGLVVRPLDTSSGMKAKLRPDYDVYVRRIFAGTGTAKDRAGGFEYALSATGPVVGRVGTGFDHALAKDMLDNPARYVGRVAKVQAEQQYASGALAKPAFIEWHLDKGKIVT
jgi:hypothetical protein